MRGEQATGRGHGPAPQERVAVNVRPTCMTVSSRTQRSHAQKWTSTRCHCPPCFSRRAVCCDVGRACSRGVRLGHEETRPQSPRRQGSAACSATVLSLLRQAAGAWGGKAAEQ